jgi:hypothetical protein
VGDACVTVGAGVEVAGCVGVGLDEGTQADKTRLTNKNAINVRFIVRVLFQRKGFFAFSHSDGLVNRKWAR